MVNCLLKRTLHKWWYHFRNCAIAGEFSRESWGSLRSLMNTKTTRDLGDKFLGEHLPDVKPVRNGVI